MSKQPEALRLAEILDSFHEEDEVRPMAAELRRLHALNAELLDALKLIADNHPAYTLTAEAMRDIARIAIAKAEGQP